MRHNSIYLYMYLTPNIYPFSCADEPSQPGRPNILDWGPNHCDLNWALPESDGGAPITHYVIELKVGSTRQALPTKAFIGYTEQKFCQIVLLF